MERITVACGRVAEWVLLPVDEDAAEMHREPVSERAFRARDHLQPGWDEVALVVGRVPTLGVVRQRERSPEARIHHELLPYRDAQVEAAVQRVDVLAELP